jgi:hypothetical protein
MLLALTLLLGFTLAAAAPNPLPDPASVVLSPSGRARFTVLSPTLLRMQYSANGSFSDAPTTTIVNRRLPVPAFAVAHPNSTAVAISTASLQLTFVDDDAAAACTPGSWVTGADAGLPRTRLPQYPSGAPTASAGECCALCGASPGCAGWVWGESSGQPTCWPLASFSGHAPATGRTFGVSSGRFLPGKLVINGSAPGVGPVAWTPGAAQAANLQGTLSFMDCYTTPAQCFQDYMTGLGPGLLARDGWTLLDDSGTALRTPAAPGGIPWWAAADATAQDLYFLLYGDDFKGALAGAASVMGAPEMPPRAALGVFWSQNYPWTNTSGNASVVTGVLDNYASFGIPLSTLVLDMDWHTRHYSTKGCETWGSWDFNASAFPDPAGFLQWLRTAGSPLGHPLAVSLNVHPQTGVYSCLERYQAFASAVGFDASTNATIPCDMSNSTWVRALFDVYYSVAPLSGVDWWWTDYQGCTNSSAPGQPPPLLWSNFVYAEARGVSGKRPMTFSRYGGLGSHRAPIGFSGDTFQHELTLDFEVRMTPLAANVLFGWWSHDIGGFHADSTTTTAGACPGDSNPANASGAELFSRWLQFGALSPILRTHCGGCGPEGPPTCSCDRRIWRFPSHFEVMRDAMRLREALVPYLYTAARAFHDTAVAPLRALYLEAPADSRSYAHAHQYHFGGDLVAAPITGASPGGLGAVNASVYLPAGSAWVAWLGGGGLLPGGTLNVRAYQQGEIPLFARAPALLPLALVLDVGGGAGPGAGATSPGIAWTLWAAGFETGGGAQQQQQQQQQRGSTVLYEDDGNTQAYKHGEDLVTSAAYVWGPAGGGFALTLRVEAGVGGYAGAPASRAHAVHVRGWAQRGLGEVASVLVNGAPVPQGGGTPGWGVVQVPASVPQLVLPDGTLVVRVGEVGLGQALEVVVSV